MGIYSDAAIVLNSKGLECFNAQLENIEKDMRNDILEFLDWPSKRPRARTNGCCAGVTSSGTVTTLSTCSWAS